MSKIILFRAKALLCLSVGLLALSAFSAHLALRELQASLKGQDDNLALRSLWVSPTATIPISSGARQQRILLTGCLSILAGDDFLFQDAQVRSVLTRNCAVQAQHSQSLGIALSEAAAVLAVERLELGDLEGVAVQLSLSRQLAPTDIGLLLHRLRIGFRAFPIDQLAKPGGLLELELPVLIGSGSGVMAAADLYIQVAELRPIVDRLSDALPAVDRQRFLRAVERRANG